ncbi:GTPase Era [Mycoplasmopsis alligatoris]|uniref:GTPase Era n=1 Tax=Mycoplasmopsis alligatoris A21JP2 TaxID=747682 RepID=D4XVK9_9BACT|nr:GTPase Era [Mycoplasmopsis alligatoris]EFF41618.1 GTP-binding protein Era [Mycoplasmopsis alligatoris A21JP2]
MKVCFCTIIGRPNVGKSSLLNAILSYNLSIVTATPQTTRDQIMGVYNEEGYQVIFTDTPGIHKPINKLGDALNKNAYDTLKENDLVIFLSPGDEMLGKGDLMILENIKNIENKIAIVSKIDKIKSQPELLVEKIERLNNYNFKQIISTSTFNDKSISSLIEIIKTFAYEDNAYYDEDFLTDKTMRFLAKEIIRESAINALYEELPHSIAIDIEDFIESEDSIEINAYIYVKKDSQKGMVIGEGGKKIKQIGMLARKKISAQFDTKVNLNLSVKVAKKWVDDEKAIKKFGY